MSDDFQINITGIDAVCDALDNMPARIVKNAYVRALTAAAVPIVEALETSTPVLTGDLKGHIVTDIGIQGEGRGGTIQIGFGRKGYIARFIEFGHRIVGHRPKLKEYGTKQAKPFMRPAAETAGDAAVEAFGESIKDSIDGGLT